MDTFEYSTWVLGYIINDILGCGYLGSLSTQHFNIAIKKTDNDIENCLDRSVHCNILLMELLYANKIGTYI